MGFRDPWGRQLKPRGALTRPLGARCYIEYFRDVSDQYPAVKITADAHGKMMALIRACPVEISWLCPTKVEADDSVVIYDVLVPHQLCSLGSTAKLQTAEIDGEDRLLCQLMDEGKYDMIRDLICWGHSHAGFSTLSSFQDEDQTLDFMGRMRHMHKTHFVRLIANKSDELSASLYLLEKDIAIHHALILAESPTTGSWRTWAKTEVRNKVIIKRRRKSRKVPLWKPFELDPLPLGADLIPGETVLQEVDDESD